MPASCYTTPPRRTRAPHVSLAPLRGRNPHRSDQAADGFMGYGSKSTLPWIGTACASPDYRKHHPTRVSRPGRPKVASDAPPPLTLKSMRLPS
jgi:hypothetical protein